MKRTDEVIKRFKELSSYNPQKGILNEAYGDVDTSGYICVGELKYDPWLKGLDKIYVMVSPQKILKWGKEMYDVRYTENPDGTGEQTDSIPGYLKNYITIYPEHQDDEYGEIFLGKRKGNEELLKQKHQDFLSKLFIINGNVIIHHNSSYRIRDGFVKKGKANVWSNNNDVGIYFWGSRYCGNDQSNASSYTYYSIIPLSDLYDFETNAERISLDVALRKYKYAGQYWKKGDAVVINTLQTTPIWCILDKDNGKWFDKDWNEIEKPFE